jgi:hypothetical protein
MLDDLFIGRPHLSSNSGERPLKKTSSPDKTTETNQQERQANYLSSENPRAEVSSQKH